MSATLTATSGHATAGDCPPALRVTRSLLGYGVIAGPASRTPPPAPAPARPGSLGTAPADRVRPARVQAALQDGFDLTRHAWSQLAAGPQGWIQMANLILSGAMV